MNNKKIDEFLGQPGVGTVLVIWIITVAVLTGIMAACLIAWAPIF